MNRGKLMDRALMWLHELEIIRLNRGLAVFRPAMTIRLKPDRRRFVQSDFEPLKIHYDEQVLQVHIIAEYAHPRTSKRWRTQLQLRHGVLRLCPER